MASAWPDDSLAPAAVTLNLLSASDWVTVPDQLASEFASAPAAETALVLLDDVSAGMTPAAFASLLDTASASASAFGRCVVWAVPDSPEWGSSALAQVLSVRERVGTARSVKWDGKTTQASITAVAGQVASCPGTALPGVPVEECSPEEVPARLPQDNSMVVNVFNSTWRNGLARQTAWQLASRNISVSAVANDPWGAYIPGVADIRFGKPGRAAAWALALHVPGARLVNDGRSSTTVDVVLGQSFTGLADSRGVRVARDLTRLCTSTD